MVLNFKKLPLNSVCIGFQKHTLYHAVMAKRGRRDNWIGHILRRSCVIKHVIERKIDGNDGKTRKRRKRLLDNLKETRGCWKLKE
jgi:hypothetical protein